MLTHEEEIKVRLFQSIADNADKLCDSSHYYKPLGVASIVNEVYDTLFTNKRRDYYAEIK